MRQAHQVVLELLGVLEVKDHKDLEGQQVLLVDRGYQDQQAGQEDRVL